MTVIRTDVLICGAGPTGLVLAIDLARRGVAFHLVDKAQGPFTGSRGKGIRRQCRPSARSHRHPDGRIP